MRERHTHRQTGRQCGRHTTYSKTKTMTEKGKQCERYTKKGREGGERMCVCVYNEYKLSS